MKDFPSNTRSMTISHEEYLHLKDIESKSGGIGAIETIRVHEQMAWLLFQVINPTIATISTRGTSLNDIYDFIKESGYVVKSEGRKIQLIKKDN